MEPCSARIHPLPVEVGDQIQSSIVIASLDEVVLELVKNALDAGADNLDIQIDISRGYCAVTDNGVGIPAKDFSEEGHLGKMHCTSKINTSLSIYGQSGRFLACLSAVSLLTIHSQHRTNQLQSSLTLHRSRVISRSMEVLAEDNILDTNGTKVIVRDLFGNMPVRLKHRAMQLSSEGEYVKLFEKLKKSLVALQLAWAAPLNLNVRELHSKQRYSSHRSKGPDLETGKKTFSLDHIQDTLIRVGYVPGQERGNWKVASARTDSASIRAAISLTPSPSRNLQFMSFGIRPLDSKQHNMLFDEINRLFELSSFGFRDNESSKIEKAELADAKEQTISSVGYLQQERSKSSKGVDRWPAYYVRIDTKLGESSLETDEYRFGQKESHNTLQLILTLLRSLVQEFLTVHGFHTSTTKHRGSRLVTFGWSKPASLLNLIQFSSDDEPSRRSSQAPHTATWSTSSEVVLRPGSKGRPFNNWPRVKVGQSSTSIDSLDGLPKGNCFVQENSEGIPSLQDRGIAANNNDFNEFHRQAETGTDFQILLDDLSDESSSDKSNATDVLKARAGEYSGEGTDFENPDKSTNSLSSTQGLVVWNDPKAGNQVYLDSRTGLILPHQEIPTLEVENELLESKRSTPESHPELPRLTREITKESLEHRIEMPSHTPSNPLYRSNEELVPSSNHMANELIETSSSLGCTTSAFTDYTTFGEHCLSKESLEAAVVLGQVDNKFVLVRLQTSKLDEVPQTDNREIASLLVLIDQHAADERVKVEALYHDFCHAKAVFLDKPIIFEASQIEAQLFDEKREYFQRCQVVYTIKKSILLRPYSRAHGDDSKQDGAVQHIAVMGIPSIIAERCRVEPKIIIDLLRKAVWSEEIPMNAQASLDHLCSEQPWTSLLAGCPAGLLDMMNSRACRSAIMFNDVLSLHQCEDLVKRLSKCVLPFQCAHGRPSMVALANLSSQEAFETSRSFADTWKEWQDDRSFSNAL